MTSSVIRLQKICKCLHTQNFFFSKRDMQSTRSSINIFDDTWHLFRALWWLKWLWHSMSSVMLVFGRHCAVVDHQSHRSTSIVARRFQQLSVAMGSCCHLAQRYYWPIRQRCRFQSECKLYLVLSLAFCYVLLLCEVGRPLFLVTFVCLIINQINAKNFSV